MCAHAICMITCAHRATPIDGQKTDDTSPQLFFTPSFAPPQYCSIVPFLRESHSKKRNMA